MIKKYLTKPEEILALKDTDTKIYIDGLSTYYQYVGGVLCRFHEKYPAVFNCGVELNGLDPLYILVEEPVKEATEKDIGKLCYFWDDESENAVGVLEKMDESIPYPYRNKDGFYYHCRRLTPAEVAEITGYKVEE
jgi:hypothetical protein